MWETFKAYLSGHIISYAAHIRRCSRARQTECSLIIQEIDKSYASNPEQSLYKKRIQCQTEFSLLATKDPKLQLLKSRQRVFESGELLAGQARATAVSSLILGIKSSSSSVVSDSKFINETFSKFYSDLYTSDFSSVNGADAMSHIKFPTTGQELAEPLAVPISTAEIKRAIAALQSGKSPGPDSYTGEFYKKFRPLFSILLKDMYKEALLLGHLPPLNSAVIMLLLRKDKDQTDRKSVV